MLSSQDEDKLILMRERREKMLQLVFEKDVRGLKQFITVSRRENGRNYEVNRNNSVI